MDQQQATPPKKRRHSEYHDPDYQQTEVSSQDEEETCLVAESHVQGKRAKTEEAEEMPTSSDKFQRIRELLRLEFQREITQKVEQLAEIDRRLLQGRQMLDRLRYQVVSEYYRKQQVPLTGADVAKVRGDSLFGDDISAPQLPLHPAIKKIVGKRPVPIQNHLPERTAATLAKETIRLRNPAHRRAERRRQQKIKEQGIVTDHSKDTKDQPVQEPPISVKLEDEQPCTSRQAHEKQLELNASRLNNKNKFNFVVGNTSKYIGDGSRENATGGQALTYKWLVYVQGKDLPEPLEKYIKKVRFHLHPSYRPNDIVDVHHPPFQLNRHGWGEFPMRIQLFFQEHLQQKPVQLMHTVVLDKTMCGLHTMGAETTVEIWLRAKHNSVKPPPTPEQQTAVSDPHLAAPHLLEPSIFAFSGESCKPRTISITQNKEELDDNLFAGINKIDLSDDIEKIEPTVLFSEPLKLSYSPRKQLPTPSTPPRPTPQLRLNAAPVSASKPSVVYLPVNGRSPRQESLSERQRQEFSPVMHYPPASPQRAWQEYSPDRPPIKPVPNGHHQGKKNVVFQRAGKLYIIDPLQRKLKQAAKQQSLLKPQLSLLKPPSETRWHVLQCMQHDHGYANMSGEVEEKPMLLPPMVDTYLQSRPRRLELIFRSAQFRNMRSAVEFLLRRLPLTGIDQQKEYPFTCKTLDSFHKQTALKQRCFEYLRARLLRRCLMQHHKLQQLNNSGKEHYWSLREILAFARVHGYTPPLKDVLPGVQRRKQKLGDEEQLAQRVQAQLKGEPQPQLSAYSSLSSGTRLEAWITKQSERLLGNDQKMRDKEFIDVLGVDKPHAQAPKETNLKMMNNRQLLYLPPPKHLDSALQLVQEMCKDINITLEPEESPPGISQPLALSMLGQVLCTFVERLVRRSLAAKLQQETLEQLPPAAANAPLFLQPQDIGRVISQCAELDFLGNSHLGVAPLEPQI
ncbi:YEATS domain-containing protein 2 [Drosophila erecta]|uniref:YEATS domain-containing protein n=1 Tax=Drosophila erecta TaxID=7220 RepID=B3N7G5_DROER|nr:YEATS domain-containing protein 2 [Drosophila erecta]EDV59370.1 uncharacterized protein Dere_GG23437 [Drosophila erecta]